MTLQACPVLLFDRVARIRGEADRDRIFAATGFNVCLAGSMAGFATAFLQFRSRLGERFAHERMRERLSVFLVAAEAGLLADVVAVVLTLRASGGRRWFGRRTLWRL